MRPLGRPDGLGNDVKSCDDLSLYVVRMKTAIPAGIDLDNVLVYIATCYKTFRESGHFD